MAEIKKKENFKNIGKISFQDFQLNIMNIFAILVQWQERKKICQNMPIAKKKNSKLFFFFFWLIVHFKIKSEKIHEEMNMNSQMILFHSLWVFYTSISWWFLLEPEW